MLVIRHLGHQLSRNYHHSPFWTKLQKLEKRQTVFPRCVSAKSLFAKNTNLAVTDESGYVFLPCQALFPCPGPPVRRVRAMERLRRRDRLLVGTSLAPR